jgi:hypothetical protein
MKESKTEEKGTHQPAMKSGCTSTALALSPEVSPSASSEMAPNSRLPRNSSGV